MNEEVKNLVLPEPMVLFKSVRKIGSYLARAKLYPFHCKVRSEKCAKNRCDLCDCVTDTDTFTSTVTGESSLTNHQVNCDDRCIKYIMQAKLETIY